MDLARFKDCSAAFGAERRRWPEREHALYDRFANTREGKAILADAGRIDSFLDMLEPARSDMHRRQLISVLRRPAWRRLGMPIAALAASAVIGFVVGCLQTQDVADVGAVAQLLLGPESLQEFGL
jgi:hypothetical protein